jgi:ankyrin repeat protein
MSTAHPDKPEAAPPYYAASLGFRDLAKQFIAKSIQSNVNTTSTSGYEVTPMHAAASAGHANILSL